VCGRDGDLIAASILLAVIEIIDPPTHTLRAPIAITAGIGLTCVCHTARTVPAWMQGLQRYRGTSRIKNSENPRTLQYLEPDVGRNCCRGRRVACPPGLNLPSA
jgi:hypothetical protein